jgi:hypothetical protein
VKIESLATNSLQEPSKPLMVLESAEFGCESMKVNLKYSVKHLVFRINKLITSVVVCMFK